MTDKDLLVFAFQIFKVGYPKIVCSVQTERFCLCKSPPKNFFLWVDFSLPFIISTCSFTFFPGFVYNLPLTFAVVHYLFTYSLKRCNTLPISWIQLNGDLSMTVRNRLDNNGKTKYLYILQELVKFCMLKWQQDSSWEWNK